MDKSVYIIDCDGVLYPQSELSLRDIVNAMKKVYREDVGLSGDEQKQVSANTIKQGRFGAFNYILAICEAKGYDFDLYCRQMAEATDYSNIKPNKSLQQKLFQAAKEKRVIIFSNNSYAHIDKVVQQVLGVSAVELNEKGIEVKDVKSTLKDGYFHPKQSEFGFKYFLENINEKGEDCVLFDDTQKNLQSASRHKIAGVLISPDNKLEKYLLDSPSLAVGRAHGHNLGSL